MAGIGAAGTRPVGDFERQRPAHRRDSALTHADQRPHHSRHAVDAPAADDSWMTNAYAIDRSVTPCVRLTITLPKCSRTYGQAPCTAPLSTTAGRCFNNYQGLP